jgi:hypothetical protein
LPESGTNFWQITIPLLCKYSLWNILHLLSIFSTQIICLKGKALILLGCQYHGRCYVGQESDCYGFYFRASGRRVRSMSYLYNNER